jgi:hypothetical protein
MPMNSETTARPYSTYSVLAAPAQTRTKLQLGPGLYSLSSLATVPYVSFVGLGQHEKLFSWGELVEVPVGKMITVKNASYHQGDIFINAGQDYATLPSRVTVPVPVTDFGIDGGFHSFATLFPVDTRRARRAYFVTEITVNLGGSKYFRRGEARQHSLPQTVSPTLPVAPPFFPARSIGYQEDVSPIAPLGITRCYWPLGMCSSLSDDTRPHALLDTAWPGFFLEVPDTIPNLNKTYFVLEYA